MTSAMSSRKRKADEEEDDGYGDERYGVSRVSPDVRDRMSTSPANSPSLSSRPGPRLTAARNKRIRSDVTGRPLTMPRLLETLDLAALRTMLQSVCERHPELEPEMVTLAPAPSVEAALAVLGRYAAAFRAAFPFGGSPTSEYAYNRVRQPLTELLHALGDFTPHFLPPHETQPATSLRFLDGATDLIHQLPTWDNSAHNHHKALAYEEISKAWAAVIREAAKRGAGIQLQYDGWDRKLAKHDHQAQGRMQTAVNELSTRLGWMGAGRGGAGEAVSIRDQLLSGTYGNHRSVPV
ncbi:MAG: Tethering factor for nuclear proteasome sts1 [Phylliscum demangeonii]|nr:MAG: Tethering factor for nuclear proteasome sts1 [Phylliscum demangeonii]